MKLKTKLYLFQIILTSVLLTFLGVNYYSYQYQYQKDIESYVEDEVKLHKKAILSSIENANLKFVNRKELFYNIHQDALSIIKKNPNIDLKELQQNLKIKFNLLDTNIELYLIDKTYTIFRTTYPKDLGFNLSVARDATDLLNKTSIDGKIYISDFTSTDSLSMEYKLYSYSKLDENSYLELGFIDKRIDNTAKSTITQNLNFKNKIEVFVVGKNDKGFYKYNMSAREGIEKKQDFFENLKIITLDDSVNYPIINAGLTFTQKSTLKNNNITVISPIFERNMYDVLGFENIVMNLQIDISEKQEFLQNYKTMFIVSLLIIAILLILLYLFIKTNFNEPIAIILDKLNKSQKVEDKSILSSNDELADISNRYNSLFDKLTKEINLNSNLLKENKRFIADTVHQIRTPLTNILMNAEMVKKFQKDDSLSNFIDKIDSSINMLSNSYEDLAYVTTSDTIEYNPTKINLSLLLKKQIKFFHTISKVNKKEIASNIEDDIYIYINEIECERIIDNNISNAIKYGAKKREITINLFKINDKITMEFKTYGNPILNKERIFEKNYRENEAQRGLGIGLNMVKGICEKYNIIYDVTYHEEQNIFIYNFKII